MKRTARRIDPRGHRWFATSVTLTLPVILGLIAGVGLPSHASTQAKGPTPDSKSATGTKLDGNPQRRAKQGDAPRQDRSEITDRSLYSEVIFAEIFEKDVDKACKLLEQLLARRPKNSDLSREAKFRYQRLALSSGQIDRYISYLEKVLERKDLDKRNREWVTTYVRNLRGKWGKELRNRVDTYKSQLDKAQDKTPAEREAIRQKFLDSIYNYLNRGRPTPREPEAGSRENLNTQHAMRIRRAQDLQTRIDKLEKAGRGNSSEAQKLRGELKKVIQEKDSPQRGNRRGNWRGIGSMRGFYSARKRIEDSGDTKRLAEFDKLRVEVENLIRSRQHQKARDLLKEAEKRFPELKRNRRR